MATKPRGVTGRMVVGFYSPLVLGQNLLFTALSGYSTKSAVCHFLALRGDTAIAETVRLEHTFFVFLSSTLVRTGKGAAVLLLG